MRIFEWDTRSCRSCGRDRVHYRTEAGWSCVGTLDGGSARCCEGEVE